MAKRRHRKKVYPGGPDELVAISPERVKAVLAESGLSQREAVRELARHGVTVRQQSLDYLVRGQARGNLHGQPRCRASLRDGLARIAGIESEWLSGEHDLVNDWVLSDWQGGVDLNGRPLPHTPLGKAARRAREQLGLPLHQATPRYQLIVRRLERDLFGAPRKGGRHSRRRAMRLALSLTFWRRWLGYDWAGGVIAQADMDEFTVSMGKALRLALKPWIEGGTVQPQIRAARVRRLFTRLETMALETEGAIRSDAQRRLARRR